MQQDQFLNVIDRDEAERRFRAALDLSPLAAEEIPLALQPFGQIDNSLTRPHGGTGLGLPLAKRLVELHGGTLVLESQPGRGTTVTISFPAERTQTREPAAASGLIAS